MPKGKARRRPRANRAQYMAAYSDLRDDEIMDALVSVAALIAHADGWVQEVERRQLLDFLDQRNLFAVFARDDVETHFERCVRELREPGGRFAIMHRLHRQADHALGPLIIAVGEAVAAADCRLDPREEQLLWQMRAAFAERAP